MVLPFFSLADSKMLCHGVTHKVINHISSFFQVNLCFYHSPSTLLVPLGLRVAPPQLDGLVVFKRGRRDDVLGRVARGAQDHVGVAGQLLDNLLGLQVPNVDLKIKMFEIIAKVSMLLLYYF